MNLRHLPRFWSHTYLYLLLVLVSTAAGCRGPVAVPRPTDSGIALPSEPAVSLPATEPQPSATPTSAPNRVVLLAPAGADPEKTAQLQNLLSELASADGLSFETLQTLPGPTIDPAVRVVVSVPPALEVESLAAANPQVRFLAVEVPGLVASQNLGVIAPGGGRPDQQGFIAGYLAALLTPDWRVGVISAVDTPETKARRNGFGKGVVFYCGLCRPAYPPFVQYPIFADIPAGAGEAELQAAVDALATNAVKTVYITPGLELPALLDKLSAAGLQIIASGAPSAPHSAVWVASVSSDSLAAVREAWPRLIAGEEALTVGAPLSLSEVNPERLSTGRLQFVERILADLIDGYIDTGINPETGDPR